MKKKESKIIGVVRFITAGALAIAIFVGIIGLAVKAIRWMIMGFP